MGERINEDIFLGFYDNEALRLRRELWLLVDLGWHLLLIVFTRQPKIWIHKPSVEGQASRSDER